MVEPILIKLVHNVIYRVRPYRNFYFRYQIRKLLAAL